MLGAFLALGALIKGSYACCLEDRSIVEYELALDEDTLTFQTLHTFGDFYDWVQANIVHGDFHGRMRLSQRKTTVERRMDRVVIFNRGGGNAPKRSDLRYFKSFGPNSDQYQNYLEWRRDLDSSEEDGCDLMDVSVPPLYQRKLVEEVNQFVWVMPCMPDASNCTHGAQRQESTIEFHRMSLYDDDNGGGHGKVVIDRELWESEDGPMIFHDTNQYFNGFSDLYAGARISVRYNFVFHRVCRWPLTVYDRMGNVIANGVFELQARYDSYESFMDDIPSSEATQMKYIIYKDGAADYQAALRIMADITDYTGNHADPYIDHRACVDCCVGNESFAEYEVSLDTDYLANMGSFNAFDELIDWIADNTDPDDFIVRKSSKESYARVKDVLTMVKRGARGAAPSRSFLKYHMSLKGEPFYQNDLAWVIELEDDCSWPEDIMETRRYNIEQNGLKRTIDQNAWVNPCRPDSSDCTEDVFTFGSKFQFDMNPDKGSNSDDAVWAVDLPDAWNPDINDFDTICMDAERFWKDFCDFYEGSTLDLRYRRVWHRFTTVIVDFYVNGNRVSRGRIDFQARYETYRDYMDDMPSEHGTQFKVRIFQWRTEPEFWGETKFLASNLIDYFADMADPFVDRRSCPMTTMAPLSTCCYHNGKGDPSWDRKCAAQMNRMDCKGGNRAMYCNYGPNEHC